MSNQEWRTSPCLQFVLPTQPTIRQSGRKVVSSDQRQLHGREPRTSLSVTLMPKSTLHWGVYMCCRQRSTEERPLPYEDEAEFWLCPSSIFVDMALRFTVLVCASSLSDPTTGVSSPVTFMVWLSEDEFEDVEEMRDLASRLSRTCRKSPLLMASSSSSSWWFPGRREKTLIVMRLCCCIFLRFPSDSNFLTWQRGRQHSFFSHGAEEDVQTLLVRDVNQLHLIQQVHIHLHRGDATNRSCNKKRSIWKCMYIA